jgi:glycosyltransferase involved in cell wall biosynthesis
MTSDTVGGVWTYTQELVTGLIHSGHRVTLVSFGKLPLPYQTDWMQNLLGLDYRPTEYRLEWMEVVDRDIKESREYLQLLVDEVQPDVLHLSQYCYGDLDVNVPKVVVAHSDVVSWWAEVHGQEPENTPWMKRYRQHVTNGLRGADVVVAPSGWMLDAVRRYYLEPQREAVIYNGRTPEMFTPDIPKENLVLSVGRVWDAGKHMRILFERHMPASIWIVGSEHEPGREAPNKSVTISPNVQLLGIKSQADLREIFGRAGIYVATSRYEPFGLSPLEAALSRCALVMNDNPVFHELWGDAALFYRRDDPDDLAGVVNELLRNPELLRASGEKAYRCACSQFTSEQMVKGYANLYHEICSPGLDYGSGEPDPARVA